MCFSPEVDLVAAVAIGVVAVDTLRHLRRPADCLLAALPAVFAVHSLIEAFVWWGRQGEVCSSTGQGATVLYLTIAWLLPVVVPLAVYVGEPPARRRRGAGFVVVGLGTTALLALATIQGPVVATIEGHHIAYDIDLRASAMVLGLYVLATCGSLLTSQRPCVRLFGLLNLPSVGVLVWLSQSGLVSLWCFWAALTSVVIDLHLRRVSAEHPRPLERSP